MGLLVGIDVACFLSSKFSAMVLILLVLNKVSCTTCSIDSFLV